MIGGDEVVADPQRVEEHAAGFDVVLVGAEGTEQGRRLTPNALPSGRGRCRWRTPRAQTRLTLALLDVVHEQYGLVHTQPFDLGGSSSLNLLFVQGGLRQVVRVFVVPVRTLNAAHNPKYFGRAHGATFFNFANDQFAGQGGVVVPGTPKDAPYLLAGLLEQWSGSPPIEIITDSGSYTDQMFGAFWLLGYRFSPRLADLGDARLWRLDRGADCTPRTSPHS